MTETDPRPVYAAATAWASALMSSVTPVHLTERTPCPDFDVMTLSGHLSGTAQRVVALAEGTDINSISMSKRFHDVAVYRDNVRSACALWSDDALLEAPLTVPWGVVPGAAALWGFVNETLVHGWDLAVATGQESEAPSGLAEAALPMAQIFITDELRGAGAPFGTAVPSRPGAAATEVLANWNGRRSANWVTIARS
ncbi:MAG: TIGR03086 family metal-binding protein [Rhodococcus sp. (in: high G+C Gram-positive bacteria)]